MRYFVLVLFLLCCSKAIPIPENKVILIALDGIREEEITSIKSIDLPKGYSGVFYGNKQKCKPSQKYNVSLPAYYSLFTGLNNPKVINNNFIDTSYEITLFDIYKNSIGLSSWPPLKYISSSKIDKQNFIISKGKGFIDTDNEVFKDFQKYYKGQKLAFIHFTDADDSAHQGNKVKYLNTTVDEIKYTEAIINWSTNKYPDNNFTFIAFSDHSRGNGYFWKYHGSKIPGSGKIWVYVINRDYKKLYNCTHIGINVFVKEILSNQ